MVTAPASYHHPSEEEFGAPTGSCAGAAWMSQCLVVSSDFHIATLQ